MLIGLYSIFYIFDIEGMKKFILAVNFCMSVKWDVRVLLADPAVFVALVKLA